jgi:hypothetical protein
MRVDFVGGMVSRDTPLKNEMRAIGSTPLGFLVWQQKTLVNDPTRGRGMLK